MKPYFDSGDGVTLHLGDCLDVLPNIPDESVDAVVTDAPYGLTNLSTALVLQAIAAWMGGDRAYVPDGRGFMSAEWDRFVPPPGVWDECLRVLKPGGHLLCFAAPRTMDLMGLSIRIAGFEIRDGIGTALMAWVFGSGFPKGQDIGKSIDKRRDDRAEVLRVTAWLRQARAAAGWSAARMDALFGFDSMSGHWTAITSKAAAVPTLEQWAVLREAMGFDDAEILPLVEALNARKGEIGDAWSQREVVGSGYRVRRESDVQIAGPSSGVYDLTAPASTDAEKWTGWNTTLKPAWEPIIVARKSTGFNTTVANVLEHGTGALNIDACRTAVTDPDYARNAPADRGHEHNKSRQSDYRLTSGRSSALGRWPTNVVLTHAPDCEQVGTRMVRNPSGSVTGDEPSAIVDAVYAERRRVPYQARETETVAVWDCAPGCPVAELDRQSGITPSNTRVAKGRGMSYHGAGGERGAWTGDEGGGASRFFPVFRYEAKAPASERPRLEDGTAHSTVKPLELMRWLVRLVTRPGGTVLDPFAGSGTTLEAAILEGFRAVGIEREAAYADLCVARLSKPLQPTLFGDAA